MNRSLPRVDDTIVEPETREEIVRGVRMVAQPANPPHAERHTELDYVTRGHVAPGYIVAADMLTRTSADSNFATDVSVRRAGTDPATGGRYVEELAFEVVNEQSLAHMTVRAEELSTRGVRRIVVAFVKRGEVAEWSPSEHRFVPLPVDGELQDPTLARPIPIRALLEAVAADNAVAAALWAKGNPWIMQHDQAVKLESMQAGMQAGLFVGTQAALLRVLEGRGLLPSDEQRARITCCDDAEQLDRWLLMAARVDSIDELLDA